MTTPNSQLITNLEVALAVAKNPERKWQYQSFRGLDWVTPTLRDFTPMSALATAHAIRLAPIAFPDPPPGDSWHNPDGLDAACDRADALDKTATKGPLTVLGPHECARSLHDPKDVHYSVFDPDCGNTAHFFKREDAFAHAESRMLLPLLAKALRETLAEVERLRVLNQSVTYEVDCLKHTIDTLNAEVERLREVLMAAEIGLGCHATAREMDFALQLVRSALSQPQPKPETE